MSRRLLVGILFLLGGPCGQLAAEPPESPAVRLDRLGDPLPPFAVARLGTIRYRPTEGFQTVTFTADGSSIVLCTSHGRLDFWDPRTGLRTRSIDFGIEGIREAAITSDRRLLAVLAYRFDDERLVEGHELAAIDLADGRVLMRHAAESSLGAAISISPDGTTIATADEQGRIRLWDLRGAGEVLDFQLPTQQSGALCFSPDSESLVVAAGEQLVFWDWTTDRPPVVVDLKQPGLRSHRISSLAFSPDGGSVAVGFDGRISMTIVDRTTGEIERSLDAGREWRYTKDVVYTDTGELLLATRSNGHPQGGGVSIWNPATGEVVQHLAGLYDGPSQLAVSPDGSLIAAIDNWSRTLDVWDVADKRNLTAEIPAHGNGIGALEFTDEGRQLVSSSDDGTIRIWDVETQTEIRRMSHFTSKTFVPSGHSPNCWIRAMDVSPDGRWIASSSLDDSVRLWESATGREVYRWPGHGRMGGKRAVSFSADGSRLASWGDDLRVYVWDVATGRALEDELLEIAGHDVPKEIEHRPGDLGLTFSLGPARFSADAAKLILSMGDLYVYDVPGPAARTKIELVRAQLIGLDISPDGHHLLASRWGESIDTPLPDGRVRSSAEANQAATLIRVADGVELKHIALTEGGAGPVAFSPDGRYFGVASGRDESVVRLYSTADAEQIIHIPRLEGQPRSLAFSPDNGRVAVALRDNSIVIWDLEALAPGKFDAEE